MVSRCICYDVSFAAIAAAAARGETFEQIRARTGCTQGCGMCEPYVRVVISTGRSSVPLLSLEQIDRIMSEAGKPGQNSGQNSGR